MQTIESAIESLENLKQHIDDLIADYTLGKDDPASDVMGHKPTDDISDVISQRLTAELDQKILDIANCII